MSNYNPRNDVTLLLPCDEHPDRSAATAYTLPSIGVTLYKCQECLDKLNEGMKRVPRDMPAWEKDLRTGNNGGWYSHVDASGKRHFKERT